MRMPSSTTSISFVALTECQFWIWLPRDLLVLEGGMEVFDAYLGQQVYVVAPVMIVQSDNPRASELLNHQGGTANLYCRMCYVSY